MRLLEVEDIASIRTYFSLFPALLSKKDENSVRKVKGDLPDGDARHDDADEEEAIDAALRCFQTINLGAVGPTDSSPFYDDGDETITNIMQKIGNVSTWHS